MRLDRQTAGEVSELFRTLGDPSRIQIISALMDGEMNIGSLASAVDMSVSAVSHQMRSLRQMRIVRYRKEGRMVYYCLDDAHVVELYRKGLEHALHR
ncbi:MAG: ArsR/SmtB family transcription factor [Omnitrophica WOR_2 bacterium]